MDAARRLLTMALMALDPAFGQRVVVDNKPGAAGNLAADVVAKASDQRLAGALPQRLRASATRQRLFNVGWAAQGRAPEGLAARGIRRE